MLLEKLVKKMKYKVRGITPVEELVKCGMSVGTDFWYGDNCRFDWSFPWLITIGNNVTLSHDVDIIAHDASLQKCLHVTKLAQVIIEDNVFIGANSTILPGVKIGVNSIVGAMSLVNKNIPPNEVWGTLSQKYSNYIDN